MDGDAANHIALEKLHRKNKWLSVSNCTQREHFASICFENLAARSPVARACLRSLQANVFKRGWRNLFFQMRLMMLRVGGGYFYFYFLFAAAGCVWLQLGSCRHLGLCIFLKLRASSKVYPGRPGLEW